MAMQLIDGQREKKKGGDKKFVCAEEGCCFRTKRKQVLEQHREDVHNEEVIWYVCPNCNYKAKQNGTLKQHRANMHNERVTKRVRHTKKHPPVRDDDVGTVDEIADGGDIFVIYSYTLFLPPETFL
mmetsp:Transcript_718/g.1186  ORF Transcript_718/g.1186 Transcript_718/m.1186 type:complete len:126 (+) Transcript_718:1452-1829(+)